MYGVSARVHDLSTDKADRSSHAGNFLVMYNKYGREGEKVVHARHTDMEKCGEQHAPTLCRAGDVHVQMSSEQKPSLLLNWQSHCSFLYSMTAHISSYGM